MIKKIQIFVVLVAFIFNMGLPSLSFAQSQQGLLNLPVPGSLLSISPKYSPALIKGLKINPKNSLGFDFIVDTGDLNLKGNALKAESAKMIKYFLAALTEPEQDLWVNLSPYEKDRIIAQGFGQTEMGRDMLAQDYVLKQLTASLIYPESQLGKAFWAKVYAKAQAQYGSTNIPVNTFNKVWIVPQHAVIYEHNGTAFVVENKLKVMLDQDYLSLQKNITLNQSAVIMSDAKDLKNDMHTVGSNVIRELLIPAIEKEVNENKNFATLRQIANATVLAAWYKQALKESLLGKIYANKNRINGVDVADKNVKMKIYDRYLQAFKKGVYNYIKEDYDPLTRTSVPRKYFSGGSVLNYTASQAMVTEKALTPDQEGAIAASTGHLIDVGGLFNTVIQAPASAAMTSADSSGAYRKPIVGYNVKGELLREGIDQLLKGIAKDYKKNPVDPNRVDVIVAVSSGYLHYARQQIDKLGLPKGFIKLAAQNMRAQGLGAYTGYHLSAAELKDLGVEAVILGHSELTTEKGDARIIETDEQVNEKLKEAIANGLRPILCFGETLEEKNAGKTEEVNSRQLDKRLEGISGAQMLKSRLVLAYEPVWAINTGVSATNEEAQAMAKFSRNWVETNKGSEAANKTPIQYGGSMNAGNVDGLSDQPDIDGGLIGGASKKADTAIPIYRNFAHKNPHLNAEQVAQLKQMREQYPLRITMQAAAEIWLRKIAHRDVEIQGILSDKSLDIKAKKAKLIAFYTEFAKTTNNISIVTDMIKTLQNRGDEEFTKKEKEAFTMVIKDTADAFGKIIIQRTANQLGVIFRTSVTEGKGFGGRDNVPVAFEAGKIYAPDYLKDELDEIRAAFDFGSEYYISRDGKAHLLSDVNIDVVEGTNETVGAAEELGGSRHKSGGTSTMTTGLGVRSLGQAPDGYLGQLFTNVGKHSKEFNEETVDVEETGVDGHAVIKTYKLGDVELYAKHPERIRDYYQFLARVQGVPLGELKEELVIMDRNRESKFREAIALLKVDMKHLKVVEIMDGTVPHGLKAVMPKEVYEAVFGVPYGDYHVTMLTIGGTAEGYMNLGAAKVLEAVGAVGSFRNYSAFVNTDETNEKDVMQDHSRRYHFRSEEVAKYKRIGLPRRVVSQILKGNKVFDLNSVKGDVIGVFTFITNNQVFQQEAPKLVIGKVVVRGLAMRIVDGEAKVELVEGIGDPTKVLNGDIDALEYHIVGKYYVDTAQGADAAETSSTYLSQQQLHELRIKAIEKMLETIKSDNPPSIREMVFNLGGVGGGKALVFYQDTLPYNAFDTQPNEPLVRQHLIAHQIAQNITALIPGLNVIHETNYHAEGFTNEFTTMAFAFTDKIFFQKGALINIRPYIIKYLEKRLWDERYGNAAQTAVNRGPKDAAVLSRKDRASLAGEVKSDRPVGGINLDPAMYSMEIKRDGQGFPLPVDLQPIGQINISGIKVEISTMTPVNLASVLGVTAPSVMLAMS